HEFVGEVVALGAQAAGVKLGDLVACETHVACGVCHLCRRGLMHVCERVKILGVDRDGAYAEFVAVPARNCWPVPPDMPLAVAAAIRQGLAAARNAGRVSLLGLPSDPFELDVTPLVIFKGLTVQGINGRLMFQTWRQMNELLSSGRLDIRPAITHVMAIDDYA